MSRRISGSFNRAARFARLVAQRDKYRMYTIYGLFQ